VKIVADPIIPFVKQAFEKFGSVECVSGRTITREHIRDADILVIRSTTGIDATLLDGTSVRFVANASAGEDHLDLDYLHAHGIGVASALGSNANSVAEYVISALLALGPSFYQGRTLGVIGVGQVGSRLVAKASALGMEVLENDPPLQRKTGWKNFVDLPTLLAESDVVTCHVPITTTGSDPTYHLLNDANLGLIPSHGILINTARGEVVDNVALLKTLGSKRLAGAVLDVFEGEPVVRNELLRAVTLATPHIAGHSVDGKVAGTRMAYEAVREFLGDGPEWNPDNFGPLSDDISITISPDMDLHDAIAYAVHTVYDVRNDDCTFRPTWGLNDEERRIAFDRLRTEYPAHREFWVVTVQVPSIHANLMTVLGGVGFQVEATSKDCEGGSSE
tara:strand:- start:643 stop:1815 length:1173 start_codon:yes stop_codon:yes gene_type:complete